MGTEQAYINKRKRKAFCESILFYIMRLFPIRKKRIVVCTFEGKGGFGCNPKYIVEELHKRDSGYEFIWLVNDLKKVFPSYIKSVKNNLWNQAYYLTTASVWIDNYRKTLSTRKRREQLYIQTWHATIGFKAIGKWRKEGFSQIAYMVSMHDSNMIDRVVIDSKWCELFFPKGLAYNGEFLKVGSPRCDVLTSEKMPSRKHLREQYQIPQEAKIILFAPTFRESGQKSVRSVDVAKTDINFERVLDTLQKKFGGKWYLFLRLHPQLATQLDEYPIETVRNRVIDVSQADDMNQILAGIDVFLTDYSSAALEASFAEIPVFLYVNDLEEYVRNRGELFLDIPLEADKYLTDNRNLSTHMDFVYPIRAAKNNEELERHILEFDMKAYCLGMSVMKEKIKLVNDGHASKRVAEFIENWGKENQ